MKADQMNLPKLGWPVMHLVFQCPADEPHFEKRFADVISEFEYAPDFQVITASVIAASGSVILTALGPSVERLMSLQGGLSAIGMLRKTSFLSMTELSEYAPSAVAAPGQAIPDDAPDRKTALQANAAEPGPQDAYRNSRLFPQLKPRRFLCFYPMSKRREPEANWYLLPFEERQLLMASHGKVGRKYAGKINQLITAAAGLDNWEWGVTLLADDLSDIHNVVYEMRFDEVSAKYSAFGPFTIGLVESPGDAARRALRS